MVRKEQGNAFGTWGDRGRPADVTITSSHTHEVDQQGDGIKAVADVTVRPDATHFHIDTHLTVTRSGRPYVTRKWSGREPRRMQ